MAYVFGSYLKSIQSQRAAVMPYTIINDDIYVLLGIYNKKSCKQICNNFSIHDELTDLGGSVRKYENDLEAAYRELHEESKRIFGDLITVDILSTCVAALKTSTSLEGERSNGMSIIFVPMNDAWKEISQPLFSAQVPNSKTSILETINCRDEILELKWIRGDIFEKMLQTDEPVIEGIVLWEKLRRFYKMIFSSHLKELLVARYYWPLFEKC